MKHFTAVYFPEQWSITNGGVPVCHFVDENNNKEFAEFVAKALNTAQQQADKADEIDPVTKALRNLDDAIAPTRR